MRIEWDSNNLAHALRHGCTRREVGDILNSVCYPSRATRERQSGQERKRFVGQACDTRFLTVIAQPKPPSTLRPITCFPTGDRALLAYIGWRQSLR
jgi:uncharacterized DUF497 family protein